MTRDELQAKVIVIISEQLGVDKAEITPDTDVQKDLSADSLDAVELTMEFEDEFEISIPDGDEDRIKTVKQIVDYLAEKMNIAA